MIKKQYKVVTNSVVNEYYIQLNAGEETFYRIDTTAHAFDIIKLIYKHAGVILQEVH